MSHSFDNLTQEEVKEIVEVYNTNIDKSSIENENLKIELQEEYDNLKETEQNIY